MNLTFPRGAWCTRVYADFDMGLALGPTRPVFHVALAGAIEQWTSPSSHSQVDLERANPDGHTQ